MFIFIVNPIAGNGRARRVFSKIRKSKLYHQIEVTCFFTEYSGHAEEIARSIASQLRNRIKSVIVIGGDGTLHEVVNGLAAHSEKIPITFIPGGSGNDFARGFRVHKKPLDILQSIITKQKKTPYWLGTYQTDHTSKRVFVNSIGFGFDAEVTQRANRAWYKSVFNFFGLGRFSYIVALIQTLHRFKPMKIELEMDGENKSLSNCWMVTIANHPYYGGGMKIIPDAKSIHRVFMY